jgi:hypothetical protein
MGYKSHLREIKRLTRKISPDSQTVWDNLAAEYAVRAKEEKARWLELRKERDAIVKNGSALKNPFQAARVFLYTSLLKEADELRNCRDTSEELDLNIRTAGEMLYAAGGTKDMHDPLLWGFIPDDASRLIDLNWHGIGEWRS